MAKGGGRKGGGKARSRRRTRAQRNVTLDQQPSLNAIDREAALSQEDFLRGWQGLSSAMGGYQNVLGDIGGIHAPAIADRLQGQLQGLGNLLQGGGVDMSTYGVPVGLPSNEVAAGQDLAAHYGAGAFNNLAGMDERNQAWKDSLAVEGGLAERYGKENLIQGMEDASQGFANRRLDITDMNRQLVEAEMDKLRQQAFENRAWKDQQAQNQAMADYLMGTLNSAGSRGGGGGGAGGGGGGPTNAQINAAQSQGYDPRPNSLGDFQGGLANEPDYSIGQWRQGDARWGDMTQRQRRRIRTRGITRRPPVGGPRGGAPYVPTTVMPPNQGMGIYAEPFDPTNSYYNPYGWGA